MIHLFAFMFGSLELGYKLAAWVWFILVLLTVFAILRPWRRMAPLANRRRALGAFLLLAIGVPLLLVGSLKLISIAYEGSPEIQAGAAGPVSADIGGSPRNLLFASVWGANYISVVDLADLREIKRIPADADGPATEYPTPDNRKLYVENGGYRSNTVSVINPVTLLLEHQLLLSGDIGDRATRMQGDGAFYYASTIPQGDITKIDAQTDGRTHVYAGLGNDFTISRDGRTLFTVKRRGRTFEFNAYDTVTSAKVGSTAWQSEAFDIVRSGFPYTLISEDGSYVYLTGNPVRVVDVRDRMAPRLVASIPTGLSPLLGALTPDGKELWVPNAGEGTISVIDTQLQKVTHTLRTGRYMTHIGFSPDGRKAYVAQTRANGPAPAPRLLVSLYLMQMGFGGLFADKHGVYHTRPILDTPGEIGVYDARAYSPTPEGAVPTVTIPAFIAILTLGSN
jgi:YVTN family beta-propeller protein